MVLLNPSSKPKMGSWSNSRFAFFIRMYLFAIVHQMVHLDDKTSPTPNKHFHKIIRDLKNYLTSTFFFLTRSTDAFSASISSFASTATFSGFTS